MADKRYKSLQVELETPRGGKLLYEIRATTDHNVRVIFDGAETGQDFYAGSVRTFCARILEYMDERNL